MRNWWRLSVIGLLAAGLMLALGTSPSMAAPRAHVYLLRGLLNIFSLGMDTLAEQFNRRGVYATVDNHADWESLADSAAANYKGGREGPIILIGHSLGADAVMEMAAYLGRRGVPVALAVTFDGTDSFAASSNVARVLNLSQHFWMTRGPGFHGSLINVDLRNDPNIDHLNIDKSPRLHARVIAEVLAIVGEHRVERPGVAAKSIPANSGAGAAAGGGAAVKPETAQPAAAAAKTDDKTDAKTDAKTDDKAGDSAANAAAAPRPPGDGGTPIIALPERGGKAANAEAPAAASHSAPASSQ
jgi:Thioesterase domain